MKRLVLILASVTLFLVSCSSGNIKEPQYREIRNVRIIDVGLLQTTAGLDFVYYNPNNFEVQLANASGDVYIDDMFFGRFGIQDKVAVHKYEEFIVPAIIKMDNISAIKNHRDIFQKKQAKIRIEGFASIKKSGFNKDIPIKYEGLQDIERLRALVSN